MWRPQRTAEGENGTAEGALAVSSAEPGLTGRVLAVPGMFLGLTKASVELVEQCSESLLAYRIRDDAAWSFGAASRTPDDAARWCNALHKMPEDSRGSARSSIAIPKRRHAMPLRCAATSREARATPSHMSPNSAAYHRDRWDAPHEDECRRAAVVAPRRISAAPRWVREKSVVVRECRDRKER